MRRFTNPLESAIDIRHYLLGAMVIVFGLVILSPFLVDLIKNAVSPKGADIENLSKYLSRNAFFLVNMSPFVIGFVSIVFCSRVIFHRPLKTFITARPQFDFKRFFFSFGLWSVLMLTSFFLTFIKSNHQLVWNFQSEKFFYLLIIAALFIPVQTGFEEIFFRGFLLQLFGKITQKGIYLVLITGTLFGALHLMNPEIEKLGLFAVIYYIISGLFTTLIVILDDGTELSWGFHLANNLFGIIIVTNEWQALQTDALFVDVSPPAPGWDMYVTMFLLYPLMIFVFYLVYQWKNWKKVLFKS
ncbi:CPBP family intramembrane glutamic endopeptidase [Fluviicola sp.]|jgi:membrane protease YdiL (CAAX protease family)|uniref:CPBP family intramembrane glutamic endopeptidase n=1 Tax=Fluviicola sp. TaxID=1917219 RepID=UPI00281CA4CB|nr:CPBP family intramembrane glutamic endopeptidase [Fluviicola sp.]MDR0801868.1 CPBP family intramembrane metalloprotease [Fluviicola sp.]